MGFYVKQQHLCLITVVSRWQYIGNNEKANNNSFSPASEAMIRKTNYRTFPGFGEKANNEGEDGDDDGAKSLMTLLPLPTFPFLVGCPNTKGYGTREIHQSLQYPA